MATLLKVLNNLADIKSAGGVALRVRTQASRSPDQRPSYRLTTKSRTTAHNAAAIPVAVTKTATIAVLRPSLSCAVMGVSPWPELAAYWQEIAGR
jgi:hypothetical protein